MIQRISDGILLVDKPQGWTSFDVVAKMRKLIGIKKIGHGGTLDPMATGLLILLLGKATKLSQSIMDGNKIYIGYAKFGEETDTYDADGEIVATYDANDVTEDKIKNSMESFLGDQYQLAPIFSAKKIGGVPMYKLARRGKEVERKESFISIYKFKFLDYCDKIFKFEVNCSKGTYVRSLVFDFGKKLGCGAHLVGLKRIKCGNFSIENALNMQGASNMSYEEICNYIIPFDKALSYCKLIS